MELKAIALGVVASGLAHGMDAIVYQRGEANPAFEVAGMLRRAVVAGRLGDFVGVLVFDVVQAEYVRLVAGDVEAVRVRPVPGPRHATKQKQRA